MLDGVQMLISNPNVEKSYEVYEELLDIDSVHSMNTGNVIRILRSKNLKRSTTDSDKNMCYENTYLWKKNECEMKKWVKIFLKKKC